MDPLDFFLRAVIFVLALYFLLLIFRFLRAVFRAARELSPTNIARAAGKASAAAEKRAAELTEAFKQGRKQ